MVWFVFFDTTKIVLTSFSNHYGSSPIVRLDQYHDMKNEDLIRDARIKNPITQHISGASGTYRLQNVEKQKTYNIQEWHHLCNRSEHQPPAPRGCRRTDVEKPKIKEKSHSSALSANLSTDSNRSQAKQIFFPLETHEPLGSVTNFDDSQFTPERCGDLERIYWKTITYNNPLYGADMLGSLFANNFEIWNVANLENKLNELPLKIPGVNLAYLYFGMWKSSFAWHLEDIDLYSINYIHFGAPKQWYSISQSDRDKFYSLMSDVWPEEEKNCREFLRHKTFNVSPSFLKNHGIKVNKLVHYQNEFVVTFPYGYHAGFNFGYNCAESVNFAFDSWIPIGLKAKRCECISDSVQFNVAQMFAEEKEHEDAQIPLAKSRTRSKPSQTPSIDFNNSPSLVAPPTPPDSSPIISHSSMDTLQIPIASPAHKKPRLLSPECVLCQACGSYPVISSKDNLTHAHRICALYIPETYSQVDEDDTSGNGVEYLAGVTDIPVERWRLRCTYCSQNKRGRPKNQGFTGACIECAFPSCSRAFHATCIYSSGAETVPYVDEYGNAALKFYCRFHREKQVKQIAEAGGLSKWSDGVAAWASTLLPGDMVYVSTAQRLDIHEKRNILAAVVEQNNTLDQTLLATVFSNTEIHINVDWKDLICPYSSLIHEEILSNPSISQEYNKYQIESVSDGQTLETNYSTTASNRHCSPPPSFSNTVRDYSPNFDPSTIPSRSLRNSSEFDSETPPIHFQPTTIRHDDTQLARVDFRVKDVNIAPKYPLPEINRNLKTRNLAPKFERGV